jgi:hypothetical protein
VSDLLVWHYDGMMREGFRLEGIDPFTREKCWTVKYVPGMATEGVVVKDAKPTFSTDHVHAANEAA